MVWIARSMSLPKRSNHVPSQEGFTLIELLVTSGLSLILIGGSLFAYSNYQTRQTQVATAKQVVSTLATARNRSSSGDKPSEGCASLVGYRVRAVADSNRYFLSVRCSGEVELESEEFSLAGDFIFLDSGFDVTFPYQPSPVSATEVIVQIGKEVPVDDDVYRFTIFPSGIIEDEGLVSP